MKNNIGKIIIFVLGVISGTCISVYAAYNYYAKDISFTPKNESWQVDNIEDAINDLYTNKDVEYILLWENPNPEAAFSEQTLEIDFSDYKYVAIDTTYGYNQLGTYESFFQKTIVEIGKSGVVTGAHSARFAASLRGVETTETSITFTSGRMYDSRNKISDNYCVPLHIWGIK